jgi:hypothetical protein
MCRVHEHLSTVDADLLPTCFEHRAGMPFVACHDRDDLLIAFHFTR